VKRAAAADADAYLKRQSRLAQAGNPPLTPTPTPNPNPNPNASASPSPSPNPNL
jgi:hypothetical protein